MRVMSDARRASLVSALEAAVAQGRLIKLDSSSHCCAGLHSDDARGGHGQGSSPVGAAEALAAALRHSQTVSPSRPRREAVSTSSAGAESRRGGGGVGGVEQLLSGSGFRNLAIR